jgi:hypothetical protein
MAYPENKVRFFLRGASPADPFDNPPFKMQAVDSLRDTINAHAVYSSPFCY